VIAWLLAGCLPKAPVQVDKGLSPATTTLEALRAARAPRRIAVLVGVDAYGDPSFPALHHAEDDARELARHLRSEEVGGYDEVHLLTGDDTRREHIVEVLREIRDEVRAEDVLLIAFSGHGTRAKDASGGWHRYLLPNDAQAADLAGSAFDLAELQTFFAALAPARKVLIVDACFDGDGRSVVGQASDPPSQALAPATPSLGAGEAHLFATSPGRPAREDDALGHGVYTAFLLEAMTWRFADADLDGDGALTAWEAHDWARGRTVAHTGGAQVPEATFRVVGEADVVLSGDADARRRSNDALVYLYPTGDEVWSGAELLVDGRSKGTLPGTVPLGGGLHHFEVRRPGGEVVVDGSMRLAPGRSYSVEDVARLAQGPSAAVGLRTVAVASAPYRPALGAGAVGAELTWSSRRDGPVGHGLVGAVTVGAAGSPARPTVALARPLGWTSLGAGWQGDRGLLRLRVGLGATALWLPPSAGGATPGAPDTTGWLVGAAGPDLAAGVVLGRGWTVLGAVRTHVGALDPDLDGRVTAVPWTVGGLGLEVDR
jgi:hypothetical protein